MNYLELSEDGLPYAMIHFFIKEKDEWLDIKVTEIGDLN